MFKNVLYMYYINNIGGTEHFLFELSKKYNFTVMYDFAKDDKQIKRLTDNGIRVVRRNKSRLYEIENIFYNIHYTTLDNVVAKNQYLIAHTKFGKYKNILSSVEPWCPEVPEFLKIIGVSKNSTETIKEYQMSKGIKNEYETIYNPISNIEKKPFKLIVISGRLEDKNKGIDLTIKMIKEMDKYCKKNGNKYLIVCFSNENGLDYDLENVVFMKPRLDVEQFIANADLVCQLSSNMETYCYTVNQALLYGVPVIITPCEVYDELGIDDSMSIRIEFDGSNLEKAVEEIFTKEFNFKYEPPKDTWDKYLDKK